MEKKFIFEKKSETKETWEEQCPGEKSLMSHYKETGDNNITNVSTYVIHDDFANNVGKDKLNLGRKH